MESSACWIFMRTFINCRSRILGRQSLKNINAENPIRIDGTAVYLNRSWTLAPWTLVHTNEHFRTTRRKFNFPLRLG